jgi:hypothetical protein
VLLSGFFFFFFFKFVIEIEHLVNFSKKLANLVEFMLLKKA